MTAIVRAGEKGAPPIVPDAASPPGPLRIAVLDRDRGFIQVLSKRLDRLGWEHRVLASPVPADAVVSMRLSALVVDLAVLGPQAWTWLERLCEALPELGITRPSIIAMVVVLPAPLPPSSPVIEPGASANEMPSTARVAP